MATVIENLPGFATSVQIGDAERRPGQKVIQQSSIAMPAQRRILLLEDDLDTQANLRDILEMDGYAVDAAVAMKAALTRADWKAYQATIANACLSGPIASIPAAARFLNECDRIVVHRLIRWRITLAATEFEAPDNRAPAIQSPVVGGTNTPNVCQGFPYASCRIVPDFYRLSPSGRLDCSRI